MQCETTLYGIPCNEKAVCMVSGGVIRRHHTCATHKIVWMLTDPYSKPQFEPLPESINGDTRRDPTSTRKA